MACAWNSRRLLGIAHDPIFFGGFITNQFNVLLPVGLLCQLIERCTVIAEVKVSNPVPEFFSGIFSQLQKLRL